MDARDINILDNIAQKYNCSFCLPPFFGRLNSFLDVSKVKKSKMPKLVSEVCRTKNDYRIVDKGSRKFIEIIEL